MIQMLRLAPISPIAPVPRQYALVRGPARLLHCCSYAKDISHPGQAEKVLTTRVGEMLEVDPSSFLEWHLRAFGSLESYMAQLFPFLVQRTGRSSLELQPPPALPETGGELLTVMGRYVPRINSLDGPR